MFRCVAAEWKGVNPDSVNDNLRQQAKQVQPGRVEGGHGHTCIAGLTAECLYGSLQICYGIIYGMGAKSLGEQMGVEENDAACYIESFKARYKGICFYYCT